MTVSEIKAGRALASWTQADLAARTKIPVRTIKRIESNQAPLSEYALRIEEAFRTVNIEFLSKTRHDIGVRHRKP